MLKDKGLLKEKTPKEANKVKMLYGNDIHIGPYIKLTYCNHSITLCLCHKIPERSIRFFGIEKYLCSRCLGIIFGIICGMSFQYLGLSISLMNMLILSLPLIIDGITQAIGIRTSNNYIRIITGFLFGFGIFLGIKI